MWLSGLSAGLQTRGLLVRFPGRAHAWVVGQVPSRTHTRGNHTLMFLYFSSLIIVLPLFLSLNSPLILILSWNSPPFQSSLHLRWAWNISFFFFKGFIYLFLERGEGREKEREKNISVWLPLSSLAPGTQSATQACGPIRNWTSNPLVCRLALSPLSHTNKDSTFDF